MLYSTSQQLISIQNLVGRLRGLCFALAVGGFIGVTSAVIGNIIGHIPIFRRIGPQTV